MKPAPAMRCRMCGEPASGTARFCQRCGARLRGDAPGGAAAPPGPPAPAEPPDTPDAKG